MKLTSKMIMNWNDTKKSVKLITTVLFLDCLSVPNSMYHFECFEIEVIIIMISCSKYLFTSLIFFLAKNPKLATLYEDGFKKNSYFILHIRGPKKCLHWNYCKQKTHITQITAWSWFHELFCQIKDFFYWKFITALYWVHLKQF